MFQFINVMSIWAKQFFHLQQLIHLLIIWKSNNASDQEENLQHPMYNPTSGFLFYCQTKWWSAEYCSTNFSDFNF